MSAAPAPNSELLWTRSVKLPLTAQITSCRGERDTIVLLISDLTKSCGDSIQQPRPSTSLTLDVQAGNLYGLASMMVIVPWGSKEVIGPRDTSGRRGR